MAHQHKLFGIDDCLCRISKILGQPSHELMEQMSEAEQDRTEKQRTDLGPSGLETYDQQLKQAIEENEVMPVE